MASEEKTTIQIDVETRDRLKKLSEVYERSVPGEIRWLVNQEWERWQRENALKEVLQPQSDTTAISGR